jgi:adenosylcobinamide-GDP ribazoletransferase
MFQSSPLRHVIVAVQFMTRLPTPAIETYRDDDMARAANWIPAAGLVVGAGLAAVHALAGFAGPTVAALATLVFWVWVTGALHLDGLADSADGLAAAHRGPERFLAAARDPYVGTFGVVAVCLALLAKFAALGDLAAHEFPVLVGLLLIPALARWIAASVAHGLPALGAGRGADFKAGITTSGLIAWAVVLAIPTILLVPAVALTAGVVLGLAIWYWRAALGGVTGDTIGATIEVAECGMLVALAAVSFSLLPGFGG